MRYVTSVERLAVESAWTPSITTACAAPPVFQPAGWRSAPTNDHRGIGLEKGANRRSPGSPSGEQALARLVEEVSCTPRAARLAEALRRPL